MQSFATSLRSKWSKLWTVNTKNVCGGQFHAILAAATKCVGEKHGRVISITQIKEKFKWMKGVDGLIVQLTDAMQSSPAAARVPSAIGDNYNDQFKEHVKTLKQFRGVLE